MNKNPEVKNSLKTLKFRNRKLVLAFMRMSGAVSVNEISRATGLSKMTVHKIIDYYLKEGMVALTGKGESTDEGGKKPNLFSFNPGCRFIFAIRLVGRELVTAFTNLKGAKLLESTRRDTSALGYAEVIRLIGEDFVRYVDYTGLRAGDCLAVVVGCDGIVNVRSGACRAVYACDWGVNLPLRESLAGVLPMDVPIYVDSWWRHLAHGEMFYGGEGRRERFFLLGNSGDNVSGGMVADGMVCHGSTGLAGEIGHMIVAAGADAPCVCGGNGCLEAMVAPSRLLARVEEAGNGYRSSLIREYVETGRPAGEAIAIAAAEGDALARELLDEAAGHFAVAINNIVCACDPGLVVFYGDFALARDWFLDRVRSRLAEVTMRGIDKCTDIELSVVGENTGIVGAANFVTDSMFA